jgi:hypothetical protein
VPAEALAPSPPAGDTNGTAVLEFSHCCFHTFDPLAFGDISRSFDSTSLCAAAYVGCGVSVLTFVDSHLQFMISDLRDQ